MIFQMPPCKLLSLGFPLCFRLAGYSTVVPENGIIRPIYLKMPHSAIGLEAPSAMKIAEVVKTKKITRLKSYCLLEKRKQRHHNSTTVMLRSQLTRTVIPRINNELSISQNVHLGNSLSLNVVTTR